MSQEINRSNNRVAIERIQNKDVVVALEKNILLVKKYLSVLIQSIFDNVYSMPIGLRILCKILYILARKKVSCSMIIPTSHIRSSQMQKKKSIMKSWAILFSENGSVLISSLLNIMVSLTISKLMMKSSSILLKSPK